MTPPSDALEALKASMEQIRLDHANGKSLVSGSGLNTYSTEKYIEEYSKLLDAELKRRGFTIAPLARVTDERLREAVDSAEFAPESMFGSLVLLPKQQWDLITAALSELSELRAEFWQQNEALGKALTELQARRDADDKSTLEKVMEIYETLPDDVKRKLSMHDLKRVADKIKETA